jgi:hypothetical protein
MMSVARQLDRLWWFGILLLGCLLFLAFWWSSGPQFSYLGRLDSAGRSSLYSALAGVSSGLLGFSFAAVAILIAVPRTPQPRFVDARRQTVSVLLATSLLIGVALVTSVLGMIIDREETAPEWLAALLTSSLISSLLGLAISGLSLAVLLRAIAEIN